MSQLRSQHGFFRGRYQVHYSFSDVLVSDRTETAVSIPSLDYFVAANSVTVLRHYSMWLKNAVHGSRVISDWVERLSIPIAISDMDDAPLSSLA